MSRKWITAIKQLNKVQYFPEGSEKKVPLLKEQIDIESLNDKDNDELKDIFFCAIGSIIDQLREFIPKKLVTLYWVIYENRSLSELSRDGSGTGFVPEQDENCPVCGKNLVHFKKKPPFDDFFCPHVLLVTTPLFDGRKFSYVKKTMTDIADKLIKKDSEEDYKGLEEQMKEYAYSSDGKYEMIHIINYNSKHQADSYYLIEVMGKKYLEPVKDGRESGREYDTINYFNSAIEQKSFDLDIAYHNRGRSYCDLGQYKRAIEDFNKAINLKPSESAYNDRGDAYSHLGQYELAIIDFDEAIRLKPDFSDAFINRGYAYYKLCQYEKAIEEFNEALRLKPNTEEAYNKRGLAYKKRGKNESAIKDFDEAIRLNTYNASRYNAYYYNKACCLAILKKAEEACNCFKKAVFEGYDDWKNFNADKEFNNILKETCFLSLLEELVKWDWLHDRNKALKALLKKAKK